MNGVDESFAFWAKGEQSEGKHHREEPIRNGFALGEGSNDGCKGK
jgi:hypothetical protein